jgi:hypothetical protein
MHTNTLHHESSALTGMSTGTVIRAFSRAVLDSLGLAHTALPSKPTITILDRTINNEPNVQPDVGRRVWVGGKLCRNTVD